MTGSGVVRSNSSELAFSRPMTLRAYSITAALHAQTNAKEGNIVHAGMGDGRDFSFHAANSEAAGDEDAIRSRQAFRYVLARDFELT